MKTKSNYRSKLRQFETSLNLAEIEVRYKTKQKDKVTIYSSKDTIEFLEQFYLLLLNRANKVLGWKI